MRVTIQARNPAYAEVAARTAAALAWIDATFDQAKSGHAAGVLLLMQAFGDTATQWLRVHVDRNNPAVFAWEPMSV
jgi:hypothetical protein